jgi:SAM-dependent methyltransferase
VYWGEDGDRQAIAEFRRVLRPGGRLVVETMHRDRLMAIFTPTSWEDLPDGSVMIERREFDYERGVVRTVHGLVDPSGTRVTAPYEVRCYTATDLVGLLRDAGFEHVTCLGDLEGAPLSRDTRLVAVAS